MYILQEDIGAANDGSVSFGNHVDEVYAATRWQAESSYPLTRIRRKLFRSELAVQEIFAHVLAPDGADGRPGTLLGTSLNSIDAATLAEFPGDYYDFFFAPISIIDTQFYWEAVSALPVDAVNRPQICTQDGGAGDLYIANAVPNNWSPYDTTRDGTFQTFSGSLTHISELVDTFDGPDIDEYTWNPAGAAEIVGGRLRLADGPLGTDGEITAIQGYSYEDGILGAEIILGDFVDENDGYFMWGPLGTGPSIQIAFGGALNLDPDILWLYASLFQDPYDYGEEAIAVPYDPVAHRWQRFRFVEGTQMVHVEVSPDGIDWTELISGSIVGEDFSELNASPFFYAVAAAGAIPYTEVDNVNNFPQADGYYPEDEDGYEPQNEPSTYVRRRSKSKKMLTRHKTLRNMVPFRTKDYSDMSIHFEGIAGGGAISIQRCNEHPPVSWITEGSSVVADGFVSLNEPAQWRRINITNFGSGQIVATLVGQG